MAVTHVVLPLQGADGRVGPHGALEVDVVALLDGLGAQRRAQAQLDDRRICKKKMKLSLQSEFPSGCMKVWTSMGMVDWRGGRGRQQPRAAYKFRGGFECADRKSSPIYPAARADPAMQGRRFPP